MCMYQSTPSSEHTRSQEQACKRHLQDSAAVWGLLTLQPCPSPIYPSFIPPLSALPLLNSLADPTPLEWDAQLVCPAGTAPKMHKPMGSSVEPGGFPTVWQTPVSCRAAAVHCVTTQRDSTGTGNALRAQLSHLVKLSPCQHPARSGKRSGSTRAPPDVSSWEQGPGTAESWQQGYESCCKDANRCG